MNKNPFIEHCLRKYPLVSAGTARLMEVAWDAAIATAIRECRESAKGRPHGGSDVGQVAKRLEELRSGNKR